MEQLEATVNNNTQDLKLLTAALEAKNNSQDQAIKQLQTDVKGHHPTGRLYVRYILAFWNV